MIRLKVWQLQRRMGTIPVGIGEIMRQQRCAFSSPFLICRTGILGPFSTITRKKTKSLRHTPLFWLSHWMCRIINLMGIQRSGTTVFA